MFFLDINIDFRIFTTSLKTLTVSQYNDSLIFFTKWDQSIKTRLANLIKRQRMCFFTKATVWATYWEQERLEKFTKENALKQIKTVLSK